MAKNPMMERQIIRNSYIFHDYYSRLKMIALSIFKWENLPDTCNERFLENALFEYGRAIFVEDPTMSYLTLRTNINGPLNVYNEALAYRAYGIGYERVYPANKCVLIRNNPLEKSTESTIVLFAERLARIELALATNINAQKTPILIRCDNKTMQTLMQVYDQYEGNKPAIVVSKSLQEKPLEVLQTGAPYVADKLREEKHAVWNEALEFLGINTNPSDKKKERLINAEVESNNEQIDIQTLTMLASRQKAAEEINKMYGLDVKISLRVEEMKTLWDYGVHMRGEVPTDYIQEVVHNGNVLT